MNSKKASRILVCNECGHKFRPEGKELRCQACMDAHNEKLRAYLKTRPEEEVHAIYLRVCQFARDLGVPLPDDQPPHTRQDKIPVEEVVEECDVNPEQIPHRNQKRIDATAASLLEDIDM